MATLVLKNGVRKCWCAELCWCLLRSAGHGLAFSLTSRMASGLIGPHSRPQSWRHKLYVAALCCAWDSECIVCKRTSCNAMLRQGSTLRNLEAERPYDPTHFRTAPLPNPNDNELGFHTRFHRMTQGALRSAVSVLLRCPLLISSFKCLQQGEMLALFFFLLGLELIWRRKLAGWSSASLSRRGIRSECVR